MIFLTVDPGLDETGVARWQLESGRAELHEMLRWTTEPTTPFADRLLTLHGLAAATVADAIVIEQPARGGVYRRSGGLSVAIGAAMYGQNCASGAMVAGFRLAGIPVIHLMPTTLKKKLKQLRAAEYVRQHGFTPKGRRTTFSPDELDAVAIGLQVMSDMAVKQQVARLAA